VLLYVLEIVISKFWKRTMTPGLLINLTFTVLYKRSGLFIYDHFKSFKYFLYLYFAQLSITVGGEICWGWQWDMCCVSNACDLAAESERQFVMGGYVCAMRTRPECTRCGPKMKKFSDSIKLVRIWQVKMNNFKNEMT